MSENGCVFCSIVERNEPQHAVVAESDSALAFMDAFPGSFGHVLVVPKAHATDIWSLGVDDGKETFDLARKVAVAVRTALRPDGLNLFHCASTGSRAQKISRRSFAGSSADLQAGQLPHGSAHPRLRARAYDRYKRAIRPRR